MLLTTGIDLNHNNNLPDHLEQYNLAFVWHKSTQGSHFVDPLFEARRALCLQKNIPYAAYHFSDNSDCDTQAGNFFSVLGHKPITMALDWEDYGDNTMSYSSAVQFLKLMLTRQQSVGGDVYLYGSDRITENLDALMSEKALKNIKYWLAKPIKGNGPLPTNYVMHHGVAVLQYSADEPGYCHPPFANKFDGADWNVVDSDTLKTW